MVVNAAASASVAHMRLPRRHPWEPVGSSARQTAHSESHAPSACRPRQETGTRAIQLEPNFTAIRQSTSTLGPVQLPSLASRSLLLHTPSQHDSVHSSAIHGSKGGRLNPSSHFFTPSTTSFVPMNLPNLFFDGPESQHACLRGAMRALLAIMPVFRRKSWGTPPFNPAEYA
jgi:hypothetical protein